LRALALAGQTLAIGRFNLTGRTFVFFVLARAIGLLDLACRARLWLALTKGIRRLAVRAFAFVRFTRRHALIPGIPAAEVCLALI
ncbi:hypothetical protein, partial [Stenotrophomonas sp. GbtcB23]|uniref:hypothetical protein n=1 Tax=Stenotrophomonas sp. GbtcB23 TaxID=2824768 RepID=UPI001C2F4772